jgi:hypothetical protein
MSKAGMHNYFGRGTGDAVVRELAMGRDLDLFLEDAGSKPITPQEAYELGLNGGSREWKRRRGQASVEWLLPPMSLDCLPEYKRGTDEGSNREEDWLSRCDFMDSCDDRWYGPKDSVFWAFHEAESEVWRQVADAWDLHDCGFVPANEFPVFMRRATAMEELLDMEERLRRARTAADIDLIERLS